MISKKMDSLSSAHHFASGFSAFDILIIVSSKASHSTPHVKVCKADLAMGTGVRDSGGGGRADSMCSLFWENSFGGQTRLKTLSRVPDRALNAPECKGRTKHLPSPPPHHEHGACLAPSGSHEP